MPGQSGYPVRHTVKDLNTVTDDILDPIEYPYRLRRDIDITIRQPEFTSLCPMTGLPDVGCITIAYRPDQRIIELKSLKYYLLQYRNVGVFYEHLVNRILDDIVSVVQPKSMAITGEFKARGGITTCVTAKYKEPNETRSPV